MTMASSNSLIHVDDGFNEYESAAKRQNSTTSKVWDEMTKLECESKNELKAQCNHCKTIFSTNCLKKVNKDISQYTIATQPSLGGVPFIKNYKFDADECRKAISTFLVCGKHSFRTVQELGFRYMMSIASPNFKNISRYTAARDVLMYYAKERDRNSEHTNDEYICITAHWVDKNWKLQKRIIRFRALFPSYDGLNIADELVLCLSQWGIDKKIFSITLDNASYNDVMVSCIKNRFRANRTILCDGVFFQVRCYAHILNIIVKASLELANDVVGKIQNGIKYIKNSRTRKKIFYDVADKSFHLNMTKKLCLDVCGQRDKDYQIFALSNEEWRNVAILCKFLKVSYDVTCVFSGSNYPTTSLYFRGFESLEEHNVNSVDFEGDFDESDDYKRYLNESSTRSEKSQLDIYLEKSELELNIRYNELSLLARDLLAIPISTVASESAFSMGKKVITPLRSSLKPKTGFSTEIGSKNDDNDEDDEDDVSSIAF
ncbi:hypothetical protein ERO13_A01G151490v2 [Gossypium hirsutum]|nr:hypothetical protein ERO13_A01G151490v2 [Gossypium hirsutum]